MVFRGLSVRIGLCAGLFFFMVLFLTVFFRGARRGFFFFLRQERLLIHTPAAYWIIQHLLFHPGLPLLSPAPVALGFSQGLLSLYAWSFLSYACQRSNPASSPIPVWSHHFCGPAPRPLATQPLQLCRPAQPWLPELATCVTASLPMKHLQSHLPAPELTTSTFLLFHHVHKSNFELFWSQLLSPPLPLLWTVIVKPSLAFLYCNFLLSADIYVYTDISAIILTNKSAWLMYLSISDRTPDKLLAWSLKDACV